MTDRESLLSYWLNQTEETLAEGKRMMSEKFFRLSKKIME